MLTDALVDFSYEVTAIMKKDSLDITDEDRPLSGLTLRRASTAIHSHPWHRYDARDRGGVAWY